MNELKNLFSTFQWKTFYLCAIKSNGFLKFFDQRKKVPLCSYLLIINCAALLRVEGRVICIQILNPSAVVRKYIDLQVK